MDFFKILEELFINYPKYDFGVLHHPVINNGATNNVNKRANNDTKDEGFVEDEF